MKERPVIFNSEMVRAIHPKMQDWNESRKIPGRGPGESIVNTEKLSELCKPVAYTDVDELRFEHATSDMWPIPLGFGKDVPLYSQEYVSALDGVAQFWIGESAEWKKRAEGAEKRIAELERSLTDTERERDDWVEHSSKMERRAIEAEQKLATPVRLPPVQHREFLGLKIDSMDAEQVRIAIRANGFKVEGDE